MNRQRAELLVKHAIDWPEDQELPKVPLRQWLRETGTNPRHDALFGILGKIRAELGYGGITVELAESFIVFDQIVDYIAGLPEEAP